MFAVPYCTQVLLIWPSTSTLLYSIHLVLYTLLNGVSTVQLYSVHTVQIVFVLYAQKLHIVGSLKFGLLETATSYTYVVCASY